MPFAFFIQESFICWRRGRASCFSSFQSGNQPEFWLQSRDSEVSNWKLYTFRDWYRSALQRVACTYLQESNWWFWLKAGQPSKLVNCLLWWREYSGLRNCEDPSLERFFHVSATVSSRGKQALSPYFRESGLCRNGCGWDQGFRCYSSAWHELVVKYFLFRMWCLVAGHLPRNRSLRCFPMFSMKTLVYLKASTTSDLTIQPDQSNTLLGEVKSHFATRSKRAWKSFIPPEWLSLSHSRPPGSRLCWPFRRRMGRSEIRICLDPKDLNKAILRENYTMPTIEEIATRLHGAKVFSVLDAKNGFWHVKLDGESSYLTTFHTPFGRYRWCRIHFGISSAPEVFQRRMHELIEGLNGTEVVADDFTVAGFGDTLEEAVRDHNKNLVAFLQRCTERGVKLAVEKLQLCSEEVPLIGHYAANSGLKVHPEKVRAVLEMPRPNHTKSLLRFNGTVEYLAKFLPRLSDMAHPFVSWLSRMLNGFGLKLRRKHGMISSLPLLRPQFCVITTCKMRLLSNVTPPRQVWEPPCFNFSSQWVLHPERLPKLRPDTHKLKRSWSLRVRSLTNTSLGVMLCMWKLITSL